MEFQQSFLRRYFVRKLVATLQNTFFLRLVKTNASYVLGILSPNPMITRLGLAWGMVTATLNTRLL